MIIAFSAAQGQGKTTLINDIIRESDFASNMTMYPTKSARTIINNYGGDLQKIYEDRSLLCNFQSDILKLHKEIFDYVYYTRYLLVERSFMDILAFSVINLGRFNDLDQWLDDFQAECHENQKKIGITVKLGYSLQPKNDGVRPCNRFYNGAYDAYLSRLLNWQSGFTCFNIDETRRKERVVEFDDRLLEYHDR